MAGLSIKLDFTTVKLRKTGISDKMLMEKSADISKDLPNFAVGAEYDTKHTTMLLQIKGEKNISFFGGCWDVWELRKALGPMTKVRISVPQSQCQNSSGELGDVGDGGRLKCLHGKVDTTISCVCVHVLLAPPSVVGAWSMAL